MSQWFAKDAGIPFGRGLPSMSEHSLQALWHARPWGDAALATRDGTRLHVVHPGHWSHEGGPDFRQAILEQEGRTLVGDVEAHLRASDWEAHRHADDPAYARVVLHVVLEDDRPSPWTRGHAGAAVPKLAVGDWAARLLTPAPRALPEGVWLGPGACRGPHRDTARIAGASRRPRLIEAMREKGAERVARRVAEVALRAAAAGEEQAAWEALAQGLGYSRNAAAFVELARRVPIGDLRAALRPLSPEERARHAKGILLGAAGLLSEAGGDEGRPCGPAPLREAWYDHAEEWGREAMSRNSWRLGGRYGNGPQIRVAALADFGARTEAFLPGWADAVLAGVPSGTEAVLALLRLPGLVGEDRALVLAVNAVAPTVLACRPAMGGAVRSLLDSLPAPAPNRLTRVARYRILGDSEADLAASALEEQGLLQLAVEGCQWGREGCRRCRLGQWPTVSAPRVR